MFRIATIGLLLLNIFNTHADPPPTLSEIEKIVRPSFDRIKSIDLNVSIYIVNDFLADIEDAELHSTSHFIANSEKFFMDYEWFKYGTIGGHEMYVWDGETCKDFSSYILINTQRGHVKNSPIEPLYQARYPLPWKLFSPPHPHFYWFNSAENVLQPETITIDGHECYLVITNNPNVPLNEKFGGQYKSYLDPTIGFMPRQVDRMGHLDPEKVILRWRYSDYQKLEGGFWLPKRIEREEFRRKPNLISRKMLYTVDSLDTNIEISKSRFKLNFPPGLIIEDETKLFNKQRMTRIRKSPLIGPIILSAFIVVASITFFTYRYTKQKEDVHE